MQYGLIGEKLGHSFSKEIHEQLGSTYELRPIPREGLDSFMQARDFAGLNVTIPYKKEVIPYADEVDERVRRIGAANTLVLRGVRLHAYNTDYDGVLYTLQRHGISLKGKTVLVLGSGGTRATVRAVAEDAGAARVLTASRTGGEGLVTYAEAERLDGVQVVYNCSPAGMYPNNGEKLLDLAAFPRLEAVVDAVYNPFKTALLLQAEGLGVKAVNGLEMLVAQAVYANGLFHHRPADTGRIGQIHLSLLGRLCNVALVGMPGSGKTSLGKGLAKALGKTFVDIDAEIVKQTGMPIADYFAQHGEAAFREVESELTARFGAGNGQVLSTGGGVVKRPQNVDALRQNGPVLFIDCPPERLQVGKGRPLSQSLEDVKRLYAERYDLYCAAADGRIKFHPYFRENATRLEKEYQRVLAKWAAPKA